MVREGKGRETASGGRKVRHASTSVLSGTPDAEYVHSHAKERKKRTMRTARIVPPLLDKSRIYSAEIQQPQQESAATPIPKTEVHLISNAERRCTHSDAIEYDRQKDTTFSVGGALYIRTAVCAVYIYILCMECAFFWMYVRQIYK